MQDIIFEKAFETEDQPEIIDEIMKKNTVKKLTISLFICKIRRLPKT